MDSKASRHQVGPQQTRSLSGDECCDLQCHARITTQKITRLPIFPPDDRFPCGTKERGLAMDHVTWEKDQHFAQLRIPAMSSSQLASHICNQVCKAKHTSEIWHFLRWG